LCYGRAELAIQWPFPAATHKNYAFSGKCQLQDLHSLQFCELGVRLPIDNMDDPNVVYVIEQAFELIEKEWARQHSSDFVAAL
jgi:hypothetical protein